MRSPLALALILLVRGYQATLGKIYGGSCRFHPSCSDYALEAIRTNGALIGAGQAAWRVVRCGPWSKGGIDHPKTMRPGARRGADAAGRRTEAARG